MSEEKQKQPAHTRSFNYNRDEVTFEAELVDGNKLKFKYGIDDIRYLKGKFTNEERFKERCLNLVQSKSIEFYQVELDFTDVIEDYRMVEPFSYTEAFKIEDNQLRFKVFGSISIREMIESLGSKRIKTEGYPGKNKIYSPSGELLRVDPIDNIYELYEVDGTGLNMREKIYCVKCWCTTTNKEHWLWVESQYKDDVLTAVASTFRIHKNLIPHIKEIKRQGDILLVEMNEEVTPEGDIVPLTKEQYFGLLTAQS